MSRSLTSARRAVVTAAVTALVAAGLVAVAPSAAVADSVPVDPSMDPTVTADALPTVQIDGVAWSQVVVGTTVYVAGEFTTARPAGAPAGVDTVARSNLLAYDITTGALLPWAPVVNGPAYAIAASPNGSRIYVGGDFTQVNGSWRNRFTALTPSAGTIVSGFNSGANGAVRAITATNTEVYLGGNFNTVAGQDRPRLASFTSTGAIRSWRVSAQAAAVEALVLSPDNSRLIVGGRFERLNGIEALGHGAVSTSTGAVLPWAANKLITNYGFDAGITSLTTDGTLVYGTGFAFLGQTSGYGNLEGTFAADPMTGEIVWINDCHGDTYSAYPNPGKDHIFVVGHPYFCANSNGFPESSGGRFHHYSLAFTKDAQSVINRNSYSGYFNFEGNRTPALRNHYPDFIAGTFTGQFQGSWNVTGTGDYVAFAGEFLSINGVDQQGLARFTTADKAPNAQGPRVTGAALTPAAESHAAGTMQVSWPTNWDRDNEYLTYDVIRDGNTANPVYSTTRSATFWQRPRLAFSDSGLVNGRSYSYRVVARDAAGNSVESPTVSARVASSGGLGVYAERVLADNPSSYFRLGEASGSMANWTGFTDAGVGNAVTRDVPGAITGDDDGAARFSGASNSSRVYAQARDYSQSRYAQNALTVEAWFRTTSTAGGKIVGLGSALGTANSGSYDRHVYMGSDGRVTFGVYPVQVKAITSPDAYNDGEWHHVVATLGTEGMILFLDGAPVAADPTVSSGEQINGYWRIGGDSLDSWPNAGTSANFAGDIDEVAIYGRQLSAVDVAAHHGLGTTGSIPNLPPTASFTAAGGVLSASFDATASSDPDGTIASYSWDFGDGTTGTGATPTHTYATGGTYTVGLTVTDNGGGSASTTRDVVVQTPNQAPTAAFTATPTDLRVAVDGSTSGDPDGSVTGWAWQFGDGGTASGATASHTYAAAGTYTVRLTVTDDDGATGTTTQSVVVTAPTTGVIASDVFGRTVTGGWGSADLGGPWTTTAGVASVSAGSGALNLAARSALASARLPGVARTDLVTQVSTTWDKRANGSGALTLLRGRITDAGEYRLKTTYSSAGVVRAWFVRTNAAGTETAITSAQTISGLTYTAGSPVTTRLSVTGTNPTTLSASVWGGSLAEPAAWQLTATDSTAGLQVAGHTGLAAALTSTTTNVPVVARVDNYTVTGPFDGPPPPPPTNQAPVARFTAGTTDLQVTVDGSTSSDSDGTLDSYAWTFGDGGTATGATATHTYAAAGTYPVTLTVTDDDGATGAVTQDVSVTAAPVPGGTVAADTFTRTVADGFGTADVGGDWVATAGRASVSAGSGVLSLPTAGSSASARLPGGVGTDLTTTVTMTLDKRPNSSGAWTLVRGRITDGGEYRLKISFRGNGTVAAWFARSNATGAETAVTTATVIQGLTYSAGTPVQATFAVTGTSPTALAAKVWTGTEPVGWQIQTTDSTAGLQVAGHTGLAALVSTGTTNVPVTARFDNLSVTSPAVGPAPAAAPGTAALPDGPVVGAAALGTAPTTAGLTEPAPVLAPTLDPVAPEPVPATGSAPITEQAVPLLARFTDLRVAALP